MLGNSGNLTCRLPLSGRWQRFRVRAKNPQGFPSIPIPNLFSWFQFGKLSSFSHMYANIPTSLIHLSPQFLRMRETANHSALKLCLFRLQTHICSCQTQCQVVHPEQKTTHKRGLPPESKSFTYIPPTLARKDLKTFTFLPLLHGQRRVLAALTGLERQFFCVQIILAKGRFAQWCPPVMLQVDFQHHEDLYLESPLKK